MSEVAVFNKSNLMAFYLENVPDKYRHESAEVISWLIDHHYDVIDPAGWGAYIKSLDRPQESGRMRGRIYSASSVGKRIDALVNRVRYFYNHSSGKLTESQKHEVEVELSKLRRPKRKKPAPRFLEPEEVEKLINNVEPDLALIIRFLWRTGLRVSELTHLTITSVVKENSECSCTFTGKGGIERTIGFETSLFEEIRKHFSHAKTYLFETDRRKPYHRSAISMRIHRASQRVLKRPASAHVLRHSAATFLYGATKDLKAVSEFCGHSSTDITARFYVHTRLSFSEESKILNEAIHIANAM